MRLKKQNLRKNTFKVFNTIFTLAIFASTLAMAHNLSCPISVHAGHPLVVSGTFSNDDCNNSVTLTNTISAVVANPVGYNGMGSVGVHGPKLDPLAVTIPPASCQTVMISCGPNCTYPSQTVTPSDEPINNLTVYSTVPTILIGSAVAVVVSVETSVNDVKKVGKCLVNVIQ